MSSELCPQCYAPLTPGQVACPDCGTPISAAGLPPLAPPAAGQPVFAAPTGAPVGGASTVLSPVPDGADPAAPKKWLPIVAVALAAIGVGLLVWKVTSGDDDTTSPGTTISVVATSVVPTTVVETTVASTAVETTVVATTTPTTVVETTVPTTEPPVTDPPRPPWVAPSLPEPPVFVGTGLAWPVSNPLAGGMDAEQAAPYLRFAQDVFDLMAADDWAGVQPYLYFQLPDGQVVPYTFDLQNQWPAADRLSLLLVDAAPDTTGLSGYDLTVAVVANFSGSTSILCGHLYSDPNNYREVIQRGQFGLLADGLPPTMPETVLNDPAQVANLKASCQ